MTTEALNLAKTPVWFNIYKFPGTLSNEVTAIDVTADGNTVYFGTRGGTVYRVDGLDTTFHYTQVGDNDVFVADSFGVKGTLIDSHSGRFITGVDVDENNDNHVVITLGNYGNTDHVYESNNAMSTTPSFTNIDGGSSGLPSMPVYCALIDKLDPNKIILGTELGIYSTGNGGTQWTIEDTGFPNVPVLKFYRHFLGDQDNVIEAATYGRGVFRTKSLQFTSVNDIKSASTSYMNVYPNPAQDKVTVSALIPSLTDITTYIYSLDGKLMKEIKIKNQIPGIKNINVDVSDLSNGTYIIAMKGKDFNKVSKLLIVK